MMCKNGDYTPAEARSRLRREALSRRDALDGNLRKSAGFEIARRVLCHPAVESAAAVMCYVSFRSEVSTEALISGLDARGKKLCFPVCEKGGVMRAYHPLDKSAWKKGMMGIMEPDVEKSVLIPPGELDLVICPMVAFDGEKNRMGYGGGYYDRYLPQCKKALRIGLAFETQRVEPLPTDEHDAAMDLIVTEEKIF